MPLVGVFYSGVMGMEGQSVQIVALKQSINGICNTTLAVLMLSVFPILSPRRRQQVTATITSRATLFLAMFFVLMAPTLLFMVSDVRNKVELAEEKIVKSVAAAAWISQQGVASWLDEYRHSVESLAAQVGDPQTADLSDMQLASESVHRSNSLLLRAGVLDRHGRTVAFSPLIDETGKSTLGLDFSTRSYLQAVRQSGNSVIDNVRVGSIGSTKPIVVIAAPIVVDGTLRGFTVGTVDLTRFSTLVAKYLDSTNVTHTGEKWVSSTIIDESGRVVASSSGSWKPLDTYRDVEMTKYKAYPDGTVQMLPQNQKNISLMTRWKKSRFIKKVSIGEGVPWTIVVESSLEPFLAELNRESIRSLLKIWWMLFLAIIVSTWLSRHVVRSLDRMAMLTRDLPEKLAGGSLPVFPHSRIFELQGLSENFQKLSIALLEAFGKQQSANEQLELAVAERTRQLVQEIEERQQVEQSLATSEFRWKFALEGANEGVWDWDMRENHVYFSTRWSAMLGYDDHEISNSPEEWRSRLHPDDSSGTLQAFQDYQEGRNLDYVVEFRCRCKDGGWKWILARGLIVSRDVHGRPERVIGTHADISERKHAEAELAEQRAFLEMIINRVSDPIFVKDSSSRWVLVNEAFCAFVGQPREALLGKTDTDYFPPHEAKIFLAKDKDLLSTGQSSINQEVLTDSAGKNHIIITKKNLHDDFKGDRYIVGTIQDVTDEHSAARKLMAAKEQAISATRAKSTFLAKMSHEIRTPLNAILGFSQLLLRSPSLEPQYAERLLIIHRNGVHLLALINDILQMARIEAGSIDMRETDFDLHALLEETVGVFQVAAAENSLWLTLDRPAEIRRWFRGDATKLRQILANLIGNAVKFTRTGGITVRIRGEMEADKYRLWVEVEDSGPGISQELLPLLFIPFGRGSDVENFEGTGLGLSICRELVTRMGGEILTDSTVGQGSLFRFDVLLEIATSAGNATPKSDPLQMSRLRRGQAVFRVLAVDDTEDDRNLLLQVLSDAGFEVRTVGDGAAAIDEATGWCPHLILMDRYMPELDGLEAIRRIRLSDPSRKIKIMVISSSAFSVDKQDALDSGADDFLSKPILVNELLQKIGSLLGAEYKTSPIQESRSSPFQDSQKMRNLLSHLPAELLHELRVSLTQADPDRIFETIDQIALLDSTLAGTLRAMAVGYKYQNLFDILPGEIS